MAEKLDHLNNRQVKVLRWVRDGCPDGIFTKGYEHRIIARALERRGLVAITGTGPSWKAVATAAGNTWKEPPREESNGLMAEAEPDTLIRQLLNAGGNLVLPKDSALEKKYEQLVRLSLKPPLRPKGRKLEIVLTGPWNQGPKTIVFTEYFDDYVTASPVPMPERISRYHPAVKAYVGNNEWHYVSSEHVSRAAQLDVLLSKYVGVDLPQARAVADQQIQQCDANLSRQEAAQASAEASASARASYAAGEAQASAQAVQDKAARLMTEQKACAAIGGHLTENLFGDLCVSNAQGSTTDGSHTSCGYAQTGFQPDGTLASADIAAIKDGYPGCLP
ncbi:hypothetical protein ABIE18_004280 [Arthrobacter sp. 2762]